MFHFLQRTSDVAGHKIDAATAVDDYIRVESEVARIKRAVFDAVIQREAHQVNILDPALFKVMSQSGVPSMGIVEKRAVTIDVSFCALVKNMSDAASVE